MKSEIKFMILIIVSIVNCAACNPKPPCEFSMFSAKRYTGNPIICHGGGGWKDSQVQEPCIVNDPEDPSQLIMFFAGMAAPVARGTMSIGIATASKNNPYKWCENASNPFMLPGSPGQWDDQWIRLDSVVPLDGTKFRIYYTGHGTLTKTDQIGTAICTKQGKNWTFLKEQNNPILTPSNDERYVSQAAVIKDGNHWYMHYSYRTSTKILPGLRCAISNDGIKFNKLGKEILSTGSQGDPDSHFIEWHQLQRIGDEYVEFYEAYNGKNWSIGMAYSKDPTSKFTKSPMNPVFQPSGIPDTFDEINVATPATYYINGRWLLFYQGANKPYSGLFSYCASNWDIGIADMNVCLQQK